MRISDWSSDVCSSDLRTESNQVVFSHHALPRLARHGRPPVVICNRGARPCRWPARSRPSHSQIDAARIHRLQLLQHRGHLEGAGMFHEHGSRPETDTRRLPAGRGAQETGRAWGRSTSCKSVKIWVGTGSMTKKTK